MAPSDQGRQVHFIAKICKLVKSFVDTCLITTCHPSRSAETATMSGMEISSFCDSNTEYAGLPKVDMVMFTGKIINW